MTTPARLLCAFGLLVALAAVASPQPPAPKKVGEDAPPPGPRPARPSEDGYRIKPGDRLVLKAVNVFESAPVSGTYRVEPSGRVNLGPNYGGRVDVAGLGVEAAEKVFQDHLRMFAKNATVSASLYDAESDSKLERRVQLLEQEVRELRQLVEELRRK